MPGGVGKGFFDRTWADTFDETRDVSNDSTPIDLPYGRQILEIDGRGGRGTANGIEPAYQVSTNYPLVYTQEPAYQVTSVAYTTTDSYPDRYTTASAYTVSANYPARYTTPTGGNVAYSVTADHPARYISSSPYESSYSQPASYYKEPASEFANYYKEPAYTQPSYNVYAYFPVAYQYEPAYQSSYYQPASFSYQPPGETSTAYPARYSSAQGTMLVESYRFKYGHKGGPWGPFYSYGPGPTSNYTSEPGYTVYGDYPATWTKTPGSSYVQYYPGRYAVDFLGYHYGQNALQASYPARNFPNSWYATYYNQPVTYTLEGASTSYADHPGRTSLQQPAYETTTYYPQRLQTQGAAYTGYYQYPIRYTLEAAYTVSYQYPARTTTYPARYTTSGGYSVQTTYPARYFAGASGGDSTVSISAVDGSTYQFNAPGSSTPAMGNYSQPAQPSAVSTTVYATEVKGVYQSSVQASVGASPAGPAGYIRIKYDADV